MFSAAVLARLEEDLGTRIVDAERDVRPAKTQQKISGRLRSEQATEHRYAIRGYFSTAVKHGADAVAAIRDALLGRAWMPPDRATA